MKNRILNIGLFSLIVLCSVTAWADTQGLPPSEMAKIVSIMNCKLELSSEGKALSPSLLAAQALFTEDSKIYAKTFAPTTLAASGRGLQIKGYGIGTYRFLIGGSLAEDHLQVYLLVAKKHLISPGSQIDLDRDLAETRMITVPWPNEYDYSTGPYIHMEKIASMNIDVELSCSMVNVHEVPEESEDSAISPFI